MSARELCAHRGRVLHCLRDPGTHGDADAVEYLRDGVVLVDGGRIARVAPADAVLPGLPADARIVDHGQRMLLPGFIDCHVHYAQTDAIAAYGHQLMAWLDQHIFPLEARFADPAIAADTARFFVRELLRNGTTTALVFATMHPVSVTALFEAASQHNMRMAAGKVLMDRHCPPALRDVPDSAQRQCEALIERWHGHERLQYAITPRFAPACSAPLLAVAGQLAGRYPDMLVQTHLAETAAETAWVRGLYPQHRGYLDVYRSAGLLRERAVFAHCVHLEPGDHAALATAGASIAYCPSSNLFLGSGLFDLATAREHGIRIGLGTDVGAGPSFSLLRTFADAYKGLQLRGQALHSLSGLYLATLGAARALHMDDRIGNFAPGKEADFIVVDTGATPLLARRAGHTEGLADELFALLMLGDDRAIAATYLLGERVFDAEDADDD